MEQGKRKRTERMWEPDGGQENRGGLEDKEAGGASLLLHQIVRYLPAPLPASCLFLAL